jgi:hypothetical protein
MDHHQPQQTWDSSKVWRPDDNVTPVPKDPHPERLYKPEVLKTIEEAIFGLSDELRSLSLDIHGGFKRYHFARAYILYKQVILNLRSKNGIICDELLRFTR